MTWPVCDIKCKISEHYNSFHEIQTYTEKNKEKYCKAELKIAGYATKNMQIFASPISSMKMTKFERC